MFIRLISEAFEKSSTSTAGFEAMYFKSWLVFLSLISTVHGRSVSSARSPLNGHRKLFLPFMIAMFSCFPSLPRMNFFFV